MKLETVQIAELKSDPRNARSHDQKNLAAIAASLQQFGQQKPIVIDRRGKVIAGNGTLAAAQQLGWTELEAVRTSLQGRAAKAYALADNRTAELASWDLEELADQMRDLQSNDEALAAAVGFDDADLAAVLGVPELEVAAGQDPEPPQQVDSRAKKGDVWLLGNHVLVVGDCTDSDAVREAFRGASPFIMVTDPPYGVEYSPEWRNEAGASRTKQTGKIANDDRASWSAAWRHFPGDVAYVWHAARFTGDVERSLVVSGFEVRAQIIWQKQRFALSRGHYHWRHEPCWYAVRKGGDARWVGGRKQQTVWADIVDCADRDGLFAAAVDEQSLYLFDANHTTVWEMPHDAAVGGGHSTQKPIEAMARPMRNHGAPGDVVYDPFMGTGTTLIAAEQNGRAARGLELEPTYADVILRRWEDLTGKEARLG